MLNLGHIAEQLKKARNKLGITQKVAANRCNISLRSLQYYETDGIGNIQTLAKICRCYGISLDITIGEAEVE